MSTSLYFDEDSMDQRLVQALRARGVDVQTALEADMIERPDEAHLTYAAREDRALCSFNVADFYQLHTKFAEQGRTHSGIILSQQQRYAVGSKCAGCLHWLQAGPLKNCGTVSCFLPTGGKKHSSSRYHASLMLGASSRRIVRTTKV